MDYLILTIYTLFVLITWRKHYLNVKQPMWARKALS